MTIYPYQCCPYLVAVAKLAGYTHLQIIHHDDGPVDEQWQIRARWRLDAENPLRWATNTTYVLGIGPDRASAIDETVTLLTEEL